MAQKLNGKLNLSKIPADLVFADQNGNQCIYIDVIPNKNGADQYGNTHSVTVYDKANRQAIYLGNLKPQDFGATGQTAQGAPRPSFAPPTAPQPQQQAAPQQARAPQAPAAPPQPVWNPVTNSWEIPQQAHAPLFDQNGNPVDDLPD